MKYNSELSKYLGEDYHLNRYADKEEAIKNLLKVDFSKSRNDLNKGGLPYYSNGSSGYVDNSDDHTLIIGATASMKSRACIMPLVTSLGLAGENMCVLDPKGEISDMTSGYLKHLGYDVKIINFRDLSKSDSFNPLYESYKLLSKTNPSLKDLNLAKSYINDLADIIAATQDKPESNVDPYWINSTKQFIDGMINLLLNVAHEHTCNFANMASFVTSASHIATNDEDDSDIVKSFLSYFPDYHSIKHKLSGTIYNANQTRNCVISCVKTALSPFYLNRELEGVLSNNTINLREFANKDKKIALFIITPDEKSTYSPLCAILIRQIYTICIEEAEKSADKKLTRRLNLILDEFANIPKIPDMDNMISASRSRNIRFYIVLQCNSQLEAKYGKSNASTIKNNCQNWVYLNTRESDLMSEVIYLIGEDPSNLNKHELISPVELLNLRKHFPYVSALIINKNTRPFVTDMADISLYKEVCNFDKSIKYPPISVKTQERVIEYMNPNQIFTEIPKDLDSMNRLMMNDGLPPMFSEDPP